MALFHVNARGEALPCGARPGHCPLGGTHYGSLEEARQGFEASQKLPQGLVRSSKEETAGGGSSSRGSSSFRGRLRGFKGDSYQGMEVEASVLELVLKRLEEVVGASTFKALKEAKAVRDGGEVYHLTVLEPREVRALGKQGRLSEVLEKAPKIPEVKVVGLGRAATGEKEAWFAVCESEELKKWRASVGLPPKDLHVTLGFTGGDVHGVPKDASTLVG